VGQGNGVRQPLGVDVAPPSGVSEGIKVGLALRGVGVGTRVKGTILGVQVRRRERVASASGVHEGLGRGFGSFVTLGRRVGNTTTSSLGVAVGLVWAIAVGLGLGEAVGLTLSVGVAALGGTRLTRRALSWPPAARPLIATTTPGCGGI